MKLKDIKQPGFYEVEPFDKEYHEIYEIFEDTNLGLCLDIKERNLENFSSKMNFLDYLCIL